MQGKLTIVAGFPASGKDTLINKLLEKRPEIKKIITYTDRPIRIGEIHLFDYNFVSTKKFEKLIATDFFFEYVKTGPFYKGTSKTSFEPVLTGENIIWRIDIHRASIIETTFKERFGDKKAKEILSRTTKILIKSDSYEEAFDRFKKRDPNSHPHEFHTRYKKEIKIYENAKSNFPVVLTNKNGEFEKTLKKLEKIV